MIITYDAFRAIYGVKITDKMSGKMEGMHSLSTSSLVNPFCQARAKNPNSVCHKCYANQALSYRKSQNDCYVNNFNVITTTVFEERFLPDVFVPYFRFQAFGDVYNLTEMFNDINIARHNPRTTFTLFSKNHALVERAFFIFGKPDNMIYVHSVSEINAQIDVEKFKANHPFVDHVFIVVTAKFALENDITINCARKCIACLKCYKKDTDFVIYEILKQEEHKYFKALHANDEI